MKLAEGTALQVSSGHTQGKFILHMAAQGETPRIFAYSFGREANTDSKTWKDVCSESMKSLSVEY